MNRFLQGLVLLLASFCQMTVAQALTVPGPLVDAAWLAKHLDQVVILDTRVDLKSFTSKPVLKKDRKTGKTRLLKVAGHIPGARLVDYKKIRTTRIVNGKKVKSMLPDKPVFEKLMQQAGVDRDSAIVIVSRGQNNLDMTMATRLYWQLKYYGHDNMAILDGGMAGWIVDGRKVSSAAPRSGKGNWQASAERREIFASSEDVAKAMQDKSAQLIDNRPIEQYLGTWHKSYVYAAGHIPGARTYPNSIMTRPAAPATFLARQELAELAKGVGVDPAKPVISYCNSGHLASGGWFIMHELLGNKQTRLYDGSMHEWTLEKRPVKAFVLER